MGAAIASILPDFDWIGVILGLPTRRVHRRGTHSLLVLGALIAAAIWGQGRWRGGRDRRLIAAWSVALLSHPVLDVFTTGPGAVAHGYGIPLLWPVSSRRWAVRQSLFDAPGPKAYWSSRTLRKGLLPEVLVLGPIALILVIVGKQSRSNGV